MRWPKESNAVAGGDTFWTLITRDCCIILNWVHLKKSRIIFFVIVTYWQSMARFRKNDFFKWAQKIKSVFCFIPHTHEGCDASYWSLWFLYRPFQSTHPRRVWLIVICNQRFSIEVSIHTPTKGVTLSTITRFFNLSKFQSTHPRRLWLHWEDKPSGFPMFQSTHPRRVWLKAEIGTWNALQFQSTHPRRVWPAA